MKTFETHAFMMIIHDDLITIGGGKGRISFYDMAAGQYIPVENKSFLTSGEGWFVILTNLGLYKS